MITVEDAREELRVLMGWIDRHPVLSRFSLLLGRFRLRRFAWTILDLMRDREYAEKDKIDLRRMIEVLQTASDDVVDDELVRERRAHGETKRKLEYAEEQVKKHEQARSVFRAEVHSQANALVSDLQDLVFAMAERILGQHEIIAARAEKAADPDIPF